MLTGAMAGLNTFWIDHPTDESDEARAIRAAQVDIARRQSLGLAVGNILNGTLVALVLWGAAPSLPLLLWLGILLAFGFWRLRAWWRARGRPAPPASAGMLRRAVALTLAGAALWGVAAAAFFPAGSLPLQTFLAVAIAGISAGTTMMMACVPAAAVGGLVLFVLPLLARMLIEGTPPHLALAAMIGLFFVVLLASARAFYRMLIDSLRARIANTGLLEEVRGTRADLLDAIESASEAFALFDPEDRLVACNRRYAELLGIPAGRLLPGTAFADLLRDQMAPARATAKEDWRAERLRRHRDAAGSFEQELASGRWLRSSDLRTSRGGIVTTHVDITDIKQRERQLRQATAAAEAASRAKSDFLAVVSHELRTPLNTVLGFAQMLRDESFGPHADSRYREYANDIHESGAHLLQVINDILDLAKIEAGRMQLNEEEVAPAQVKEDLERLTGGMVAQAGLAFTVDLPVDLPHLLADPRAVRQMLMNLMSNAVKFTPPGGRIVLRGRRRDDGLELSVADTGIGIAADQHARVLEPFGQAAMPLTRNTPGTGLGLTLVKSLIEAHGGRLVLESAPGAGTTVRLIFPPERLLRPEPAAAAADGAA